MICIGHYSLWMSLAVGALAQSPIPCKSIGPDIHAIAQIEARQGWTIVSLGNLPDDDKELWNRARRAECPGVAAGHFDGGSKMSYAIAFIRKDRAGRQVEKLLLLLPSRSGYSSKVVVGPTDVVSPFVVWTLPPGRYSGVGGQTSVDIATDSFVYEKIEAVATQYYLVDGRLRSLLTAD